jgi:NAD-dependent DNA ligase
MKELLDKASKAYYAGTPIMSDEEFDAISKDYFQIGAEPTERKSEHAFPMWSLQKYYVGDSLPSYPSSVTSPKLDGAAIAILYNTSYIRSATRGNGKVGEGITDKVKHIKGVPASISIEGRFQIVGEVVAPKDVKNSRNYAAGALNLKDIHAFKERDLTFIAYGIQPSVSKTWSGDMLLLRNMGFNTVLDSNWDEFPQDGKVVRIDNYEQFDALGYTSKFPRGAYALKEQSEGSVTTLIGVEWNLGRSGVISPVAILEPVHVGDALVSRATLHNMKYIEALDLAIGCKVKVIRSGEIIPRIVERVYD